MTSDPDLPLLMVRVLKLMVGELTSAHDPGDGPALTPVHSLVTRYVAEHPGATIVQLAAHLGVTKQSASELVAVLEADGHVVRRPHPQDGRSRVIDLTDEGRAGIVQSRQMWGELVDRWADQADPGDLAVVRHALEAYLSD